MNKTTDKDILLIYNLMIIIFLVEEFPLLKEFPFKI